MSQGPTIALVTKARGTFFKPLYEAFAQAQPESWRTLLLWPKDNPSEHPAALVTPESPNLERHEAACMGDASRGRFWPSRNAWSSLENRDVRAVLIHEFSPFTLQGLVFARRHRLPLVVSTEVGRANAHFFKRQTRLWHGFWGQFIQGIAACCPAACTPVCGRRVPVIEGYHAVDSRLYQPRLVERDPVAPWVFAYLGQLIHRKGLDLLLKAAAELKARMGKPFLLRIIGRGEDGALLREMAEKLGLGNQVEFAGFLSGPSIREALGSADVFVLPTRQDTYAAVVHEAACLGLPLLVSQHAGAAEALVHEGRNGFIFDPEDTTTLAAHMADMMNADRLPAMRAHSRALGEAHSAHQRGAALWEWMHQLILSPGALPQLTKTPVPPVTS